MTSQRFSNCIRTGGLLVSSLLIVSNALAFDVQRATTTPLIDGDPSDPIWQQATWRKLNQLMIGTVPTPEDFSGRYKLLWTPDALYLLAEINDDILIDTHANPLEQYWDDDMLEVFLDEDASGGIHLENFNAFAYHIALDNQIVDIAPAQGEAKPRLFPNHIEARWQRQSPHTEKTPPLYWEVRITVHSDKHVYGSDLLSRVMLKAGKKLGFMVAYGDADDATGRQHFMGDIEIEPLAGDRNRGYIDASVLGKIRLVE